MGCRNEASAVYRIILGMRFGFHKFASMKFLKWSVLVFSITACSNIRQVPELPLDALELPEAPDYSKSENWAAHPGKTDPADLVPIDQLQNKQQEAVADVFFVHPTTFFGGSHWVGDVKDSKLNADTDKRPILHQASIFNGSTRVFAPRYRQMVYGGFLVSTPSEYKSAKAAAEIAYSDVARAFQHYWEHENQGRPFILAGHSQGAAHAIHLLLEREHDARFREQLVAAYLPGWPVRRDTFQFIPPCDSADDIHCYTSWCSFRWGTSPDDPNWYNNAVCVNPVSWTVDSTIAAKNLHQGLVMGDFAKIYRQASATRVNGSILWVEKPKVPRAFIIRENNYHIGDFNLFWLDVRANVETRIKSFQQRRLDP